MDKLLPLLHRQIKMMDSFIAETSAKSASVGLANFRRKLWQPFAASWNAFVSRQLAPLLRAGDFQEVSSITRGMAVKYEKLMRAYLELIDRDIGGGLAMKQSIANRLQAA